MIRLRDAAWAAAACALVSCLPPQIADPADSGDTGTDDTDTDTGTDSTDGGMDDAGDPDGGMDAGADSSMPDTDSETGTAPPDGACVPAGFAVPGTPVSGDTSIETDDLSSYSCTPLFLDGPDVAYRYDNTGAAPLTLTAHLSGYGPDLDLFLLAGACSQDACVAYGAGPGGVETASAHVEPGGVLYVVVDGYDGAAGSFLLTLEEAPAQVCSADETISCGQTASGTTAGWEDDLDTYATCSSGMDGPDRVFQLDLGGAADATVTLHDQATGLELIVLGGSCSSGAVVGCGSLSFSPSAAAGSYYVIVDGHDGAAGPFALDVMCAEVGCNDGDDGDLDGFADCEDEDCAADPACVATCALLAADAGCPDEGDAGVGCYLLSAPPPVGFCHAAGDAGAGDSCDEPFDCVPGAICTPADICLMVCDLDDGVPSCPEGVCTSVGADPMGVCW